MDVGAGAELGSYRRRSFARGCVVSMDVGPSVPTTWNRYHDRKRGTCGRAMVRAGQLSLSGSFSVSHGSRHRFSKFC